MAETLMDSSPRTLKLLAAVLWYVGGVVLLAKGISLLGQAIALRNDVIWPIVAVVVGFSVGCIKVRYLFSRACRKNLARIEALPRPQLWQFYRPGFLLFLMAMILLGRYLSESAQGHYGGLLAVATLDLSLATALLGSSYIFWQTPALPSGETHQP